MLKAFKNSFKLRSAYKGNTIIYSLKSIPLLRRLLADTLYGSSDLKTFVNIIRILIEAGSIFFGKALYLPLLVFLPAYLMDKSGPGAFLTIFVLLTLVGGILNTQIFNPTKDKYYAVVLMRMDLREYILSNYLYFLIKTAIGFLPFTLIFGWISGAGIAACLLMPLFVCSVKVVVAAGALFACRDGRRTWNENKPTPVRWVCVGLLLIAAYLLPFLGYTISEQVFAGLSIVLLCAGGFSLCYIQRFRQYQPIYRSLLSSGNISVTFKADPKRTREAYAKKIEADISQTSNKKGYQYFNELFMKRHSRILMKSSLRLTLILILLFAAGIAACLRFPRPDLRINERLYFILPSFLLVMYFINRGRGLTEAMFMNCDYSMLHYRFYRQPKIILSLFRERLKYMSLINLIPASVIALGLPLLLYVTGGTSNPADYLILFALILILSVFFSVHTLVLYYLLQPYNIKMDKRNALYTLIDLGTYYICFFARNIKMPLTGFAAAVFIFCILYITLALLFAYRLAPKTFKLRP